MIRRVLRKFINILKRVPYCTRCGIEIKGIGFWNGNMDRPKHFCVVCQK